MIEVQAFFTGEFVIGHSVAVSKCICIEIATDLQIELEVEPTNAGEQVFVLHNLLYLVDVDHLENLRLLVLQ